MKPWFPLVGVFFVLSLLGCGSSDHLVDVTFKIEQVNVGSENTALQGAEVDAVNFIDDTTGTDVADKKYPKEMTRTGSSDSSGLVKLKLVDGVSYAIGFNKRSADIMGGDIFFKLNVGKDVTSLDLSSVLVPLFKDPDSGSDCNSKLKVPGDHPTDSGLGGGWMRIYKNGGNISSMDTLTVTALSGGETLRSGANLISGVVAAGTKNYVDIYDDATSEIDTFTHIDVSLWGKKTSGTTKVIYKVNFNGDSKALPLASCGSGDAAVVVF